MVVFAFCYLWRCNGGGVVLWWLCLGLTSSFIIFDGGMQWWFYMLRGEKGNGRETN